MNKQETNEEVTLKELVTSSKEWYSYILSKWKIILLFGLLGGIAGLTLSYIKKPVYTASLTFVLEDQQTGDMSGALGIASMLGFDIGGGGSGIFTGGNLIELFKSRTMVEQTLLSSVSLDNKSMSFAEMYIQVFNWREGWEKNESLKNLQFLPNAERKSFSRVQDSIMGVMYESIIKNNLKVEQKDKKVDIITIDMQSENEKFAKYFSEALAKEVSDYYILTKSKKARINLDILEKQTDSVRAELNYAITGVAMASDNTFGLNPALNVPRVPSTRKQVDVQANTNILIELVKQTELAKVLLRKSTPLIQIIDKPVFPLKKEKVDKLKSIIIGGFLAGIIILVILIFTRIFYKLRSI
jgi:uncharacterized protein involved in exopolysaccharide biosynthesis